MKIKMTEEIYLAPGGAGSDSLFEPPLCALGKINQALEKSFCTPWDFYSWFSETTKHKSGEIYSINDLQSRGLVAVPENHYKALKLAIQYLQEAGVEVELPIPFEKELCLSQTEKT